MPSKHPVRRPQRNHLGELAFIVAATSFVLSVWPGVFLFGWLLTPLGAILGAAAWIGARGRSWICAVGSLIATLASLFAAAAAYRDVVAPYLG